MQVSIAGRVYRMSDAEFQGLLEMAREQVPFGLYAVIKNGYAELLNVPCKSLTELKKHKRAYKKEGFKVYCNGGI